MIPKNAKKLKKIPKKNQKSWGRFQNIQQESKRVQKNSLALIMIKAFKHSMVNLLKKANAFSLLSIRSWLKEL